MKMICLERLIDIAPQESDYLGLLDIYCNKRLTEKLMQLTLRFVQESREKKDFPAMPQFCSQVIELLHRNKLYQEELSYLEISLKSSSDPGNQLKRMVEVYKRLGNKAGSLNVLTRLVKLNPSNTAVVSELALFYEDMGDFRNAGKCYGIMFLNRPESIHLMKKMTGCMRARKGVFPNREEECECIYKEYLGKVPRFALFFFYKYGDQHRKAIKMFKDKLNDVRKSRNEHEKTAVLEDMLQRMKNSMSEKKDYLMMLLMGTIHNTLELRKEKERFYFR